MDSRSKRPGPDLSFEVELWAKGSKLVAGIDEAGRGALAGPVAAGVIILPPDSTVQLSLAGIRDSKQLTPAQREVFADQLHTLSLTFGVGFASPQQIDQLGISAATRLAVQNALSALSITPQHLLVDFISLPDSPIPQTSLVKGDERSISIAGASILAKVARDALMRDLDGQYPGYGFSSHKGYGTQAHRRALAYLGPSPIHRHSFHLKSPMN